MFTKSPEVLELFTEFKGLAGEEEWRASEKLQEHGERVRENYQFQKKKNDYEHLSLTTLYKYLKRIVHHFK